MKHLILCAIAGASMCAPALAQPGQNNGNQNFGAQNGAVFQLPLGVRNVVSIDALNMIIIAQDGEREGEINYTPTVIQHVYSGGIARLFGGTSVPTAQFVSPGFNQQNGNNQNGGFGGNNQNGVGGFGNNNFGGNGGFGNGGFGNGGFGNGSNFGGNGFGGNGFGGNGFGNNFGNAILQGQGFNTINQSVIANARAR